jgi:hypothetical protein
MGEDSTFDTGLLRMAGIAGILAGSLILLFALTADGRGLLFYGPIVEGASVEPWMRKVQASPALSRCIMALPILGFSCMLVVIGVLRSYIREESWQKTLAVAGYGIGVPVAVVAFTLQLGLMNQVVLIHARRPQLSEPMELVAGVFLFVFHIVNHFVGPFFIIVLGSSMMAWAALRSSVLPRWICGWLMTCGVMLFASFWHPLVPALEVLGFFAPLHMAGYIALGVILLGRGRSSAR